MTTMRDVARRAGVSVKTVSRVFNGDDHVVDETRQRVQDALRELNYVPNSLARTFRSGKDAALGVAVPDIADPFFAALARAVEEAAVERGLAVVVTSLGLDPDGERARVEALLHRQIRGLVTTPVADDQSYLEPWLARTPVVFVDRVPSVEGADAFVQDDAGGAVLSTEHLLAHGHRRILFIGDTLALPTTTARLAGYRLALERAGVPPDPRLVALGPSTSEAMAGVLRRSLEGEEPPTAVLSSNSRCTSGVVPALQALGRTDVALVSFGDLPLAACLRPGLTAVDQDPRELGRRAAERLLQRLDEPGRRPHGTTTLPVRLVPRGSGEQAPDADRLARR